MSPRPRPTNLPPEATSFVGRERDLERLGELFDGGARLVSVLGPAGAGKTRLARRFAARSIEAKGSAYAAAGGVWFCDLSEARSHDAVLAGVGATLGGVFARPAAGDADAGPGDRGEQIGHALAGRGPLLLVLDNFEQIVRWAADTVGRWLLQAPEVRMLVTSRERLHVGGEACLDLDPLPIELGARLFAERARAVRADFALSASNQTDVTELVRRLDGLPLAIELAAARVNVLPPKKLRDRLEARFDVLRGQRHDVSPRQLTLRGAIDWSWELLSEAEREALAQCSVFRGGFSLEAAEAVLAPTPPGAPVVDLVEALVDKSLVRRYEPEGLPGELRFGLYESIRDYAAERLDASGHEAAALARHAAYYVTEGERLAAGLAGADVVRCVARMRLEADNLLASHQRSLGRAPEAAVRAALALDALLSTRGPFDTEMAILDAAELASRGGSDALRAGALLARSQAWLVRGRSVAAAVDVATATVAAERAGDPSLLARVLVAHAGQLVDAGKFEDARATLERALGLVRGAGDARGEADVRAGRARLYLNEHHLDDARTEYDALYRAAEQLGDRVLECSALSRLAVIHQWQGRGNLAADHYERALALAQVLGDRRQEYIVRNNLGLWHGDAGRLEEARRQLEAAAALQRAAGHRDMVAMAFGALGTIEHAWGDLGDAGRLYEESLETLRELGDRRNEFGALRYQGILSLDEGHPDEAVTRLERAAAIAREVGDLVGFAAAPLGAALATLGRLDESAAAFQAAAESLGASGDKRQIAVASLYEGLLDVARAQGATARGAGSDAEAHLERARSRLAPDGPAAAAQGMLDGRIARRLLEAALASSSDAGAGTLTAPSATHGPTLELGPEGRWFAGPGGKRVDLTRRRALRLLLLHLAEQRDTSPGVGISMHALVDAGWPGERIQPEAAAARVYTSIKTLRALGLDAILIRRDDGYLIDPDTSVVRRPR